jgi:hypothetical protein
MDDLIHRLNALGNAEHDDLEIGFEAAERIIALTAERDALRDALVSIEEYWNRDCNERAMEDACYHAIETAGAALRQEGE